MYIDTVTITGADDQVDRNALYELSDAYPFVEWGILVHPEKEGKPRYPTSEWMAKFDKYAPKFVSKSVHICGKAATAFCDGDLSIVRNSTYHDPQYERLQVNIHDGIRRGDPCFGEVADLLIRSSKVMETIIQMNELTLPYIRELRKKTGGNFVQILFDASRGKGEPIYIPTSADDVREGNNATDGLMFAKMHEIMKTMRCGFAGGITPDNVVETVKRVTALSNQHYTVGKIDAFPYHQISPPSTWIDMESGVRTHNEFDLKKVELVLSRLKETTFQSWGHGSDF